MSNKKRLYKKKIFVFVSFLLITLGIAFSLSDLTSAHNTNAIWNQIHFWFRDDDGGELCDSVPGCTNGATGFSSPDTAIDTVITNVAVGTDVRLRLELFKNNNGDLNLSTTPLLEFKIGGACTDSSGWTTVPTQTSCSGEAICQATSANFADGAATSQLLDSQTDKGGDMIEIDGTPDIVTYTTANNQDAAEWEWMLDTTNAADATTYTLRASKGSNNTNYTTYDTCPTLTTSSSVVYSVSITSSGTISYGFVEVGTSTTTAGNGFSQVANHDGSGGPEQLNVKTSNAVGSESTWTVAGSIGTDFYTHEVSTTSGSEYMIMDTVDVYITASPLWK